ncbi:MULTISPECIES: hypothetical protein [Enterobacterales]|uniref:hypothetical protein n=1 Tax=Enterobacterales TaxID=91347 RepID=UPI0003FE20C9|nr:MULTISPECIES: hypothetical protein [Enterobacteriaceae]EFA0779088.1 hypothetical protein [Escherichia coli]EFF9667469.1 hypothetical protein [Escherichia coli]EKJ3356000.1 hypothetical protein [Escherichia coli]ELS5398236.1 hypothetical protein [Escherichia coli]MCN7171836.1 hypothetical protein [Escherichia coli]
MKTLGNVLFFLFFIALFTVIGLAVSSYLYQYLLFDRIATYDITTVFRFTEFSPTSRPFLFGALSAFILALFIVIPFGLFIAMIFMKDKKSLHGDARFANKKELEQLKYVGPYKD